MSTILDLGDYDPDSSEGLFFDANIWMYLYSPIANYGKKTTAAYSKFLKEMIQQESRIYISSLILSEFFNANLRLEFNIRKQKNPSQYSDFKKDFRNTTDGVSLAKDLVKIVRRQILRIAERMDDDFTQIDLDELFSEPANSDFNDSYYANLAVRNRLAVVTNDSDFAFSSIDVQILTANKHLLKKK